MPTIEKIKNKYNALSTPAKASLWFVVCNSLQKATQIITTPIYTRMLTTEQYGEYTVFLSWVEVVAIIATLDIFYSGFNVGMEKFKTDRKNYVSAMHGLCIALTTVCMLVGFIFAKQFGAIMGISPIHIKLLICYMYVYPIYLFWSAQKKYDYNYKLLLIITAVMSIFTIVFGSLSAYVAIDKSTAVIIAKIVVEAIIACPLLFKSVNGIKSLFNKFYWHYALKFNVPLIPHYLSTMILNHSDRIMILNMCSATDAAIYSVAYSIAMLMTIVQNAVNSAITPWFYGKLSLKNYDGIKNIIGGVIGAMALLNLMLIIVAPEAVRLLSTKSYYDSMWIIPPVSFGYIAAGYTTLASYVLLAIVHYLGVKKVCKSKSLDVNDIFDKKLILLIIFLYSIISIVMTLCYERIFLRYCIIGIICLLMGIFRKKITFIMKAIKGERGNV